MTYIIVEYPKHTAVCHIWEGPYNVGVVDQYKRGAREHGGRVVAVIRPKNNAAS